MHRALQWHGAPDCGQGLCLTNATSGASPRAVGRISVGVMASATARIVARVGLRLGLELELSGRLVLWLASRAWAWQGCGEAVGEPTSLVWLRCDSYESSHENLYRATSAYRNGSTFDGL